jgi:hypothetical protein
VGASRAIEIQSMGPEIGDDRTAQTGPECMGHRKAERNAPVKGPGQQSTCQTVSSLYPVTIRT